MSHSGKVVLYDIVQYVFFRFHVLQALSVSRRVRNAKHACFKMTNLSGPTNTTPLSATCRHPLTSRRKMDGPVGRAKFHNADNGARKVTGLSIAEAAGR